MKKKLLSLLTLMIVCISGAWAETTVIARMQDLVSAASENTATVSADHTTNVEKGAVYDFANNGFIKGISNDAVKAALGTKYVTVAAWVYGRPTGGCIFSYGGQSDGIKFKLTGTTMQTTTKGKADYVSQADNNFGLENQWHLVAFTIDPGFTTTKYISGHQGHFGYMYTRERANNGPAGMNAPAEADQLFAIGSGNQGNVREPFTGSIANLTVIASDNWLGNTDMVADLVGAAPSYNNLDAWKAEISALENLVGGYTTAQIASLASVTSASQIETWLANNSKIAFDENKYYRVWNKSRSEVSKAAWDLHENSVAWAEYNSESKTQVWKFKNTGATGDYKYKIQNIGNPAAYMTSSLGGNAFHAYVNEANAGVFAITEAGPAQYQVHHSTAIGSYVFADGNNHLDGWKGDGKDLWYLEITEIDDVLTTITWNVVDANHNVLATETMESCAEGNEYTTTLSFAYTTLKGQKTVTATKQNQIIELTYEVGQLPFTSSANFATATWYKMKNATYSRSAYYDANEENIRVGARDGEDWSNLWAFIGNPINGYQLVNKAAGATLYLNAASAANGAKMTMNATATTFTLVEGNEAKAEVANTIGFKLGNVYVNDYANAGYLSFWQDGPAADQGSNWVLTEVTISSLDWGAFENLVNQLQAVTIGSGLGEYTFGNSMMDAYAPAYIEEFASYLDDKENVETEDFEYAMESMQGMLESMTLNLPKAGSFLVIKGASSNKYISGNNTAERVALTENVDEAVLYLNESNQLVGTICGLGMTGTHTYATGATIETHTFAEAPYAKGAYLIKSNYSGSKVLVDWTDGMLNRWNTENDVRSTWYIEEVDFIPVAVSAAGYASLYAPVALTVPADVKAYTLTESGDYLVATVVEGTIPANTGVIIEAAEGTYKFNITTGGAGTSCLSGAATPAAAPANVYTLAKENDEIGFYNYTGEIVKGFRAYFEKTSAARSFGVIFGEETGIQNVDLNDNANAVIYNLAGQRVNKAVKGIYIINGKKVLK